MGTVSVSLPTDGSNADAADYNTPITSLVNTVNGNLDSANLASNAVSTAKIADGSVTTAKLSTTAGQIAGAWQSWTPTWTNLTVGNGTLTAKYLQVGKTVHFRLVLVLGSTSSVGASPSFTLPAAKATVGTTTSSFPIGMLWVEDAGVSNYQGVVYTNDTVSVVGMGVFNATGTYASTTPIASTVPMTFGTGDGININGAYEAA